MAAHDAYVDEEAQKYYINRYGPSRVYISKNWPHAFPLSSEAVDHLEKLTSHSIIKCAPNLDCQISIGFPKSALACWKSLARSLTHKLGVNVCTIILKYLDKWSCV